MPKINFKIVTPERELITEEVDSINCPTTTGQITVLPNHIPLVSALEPGELVVKNNGQERTIAVAGGFIEVKPGSEVIILADAAEYAEEIDITKAEEAKKRAQETLKKATVLSEEEYADVLAMLQHSLSRLKIARKRAHHGKGAGGITHEQIFKE